MPEKSLTPNIQAFNPLYSAFNKHKKIDCLIP
jgi:hypothetical protein